MWFTKAWNQLCSFHYPFSPKTRFSVAWTASRIHYTFIMLMSKFHRQPRISTNLPVDTCSFINTMWKADPTWNWSLQMKVPYCNSLGLFETVFLFRGISLSKGIVFSCAVFVLLDKWFVFEQPNLCSCLRWSSSRVHHEKQLPRFAFPLQFPLWDGYGSNPTLMRE